MLTDLADLMHIDEQVLVIDCDLDQIPGVDCLLAARASEAAAMPTPVARGTGGAIYVWRAR